MAPRLLVDNDVLIKLTHWGLLTSLPTIFGLQWSDAATLESIKLRARRADAKLFRSADIAQALCEQLVHAAELPAPRPEDLSLLQDVVDLDAGEVELIAACLATPGAIFVTGDKRALRALARPELAHIAEQLAGRILCLEQVLTRMADATGAQPVIDGIVPHRDLDTAIRCIVGVNGCSEDNLREGLTSYAANLRKETGTLLIE